MDMEHGQNITAFPSSQKNPEIALFAGYAESPEVPHTDAWKIMIVFGPKNFTGKIDKLENVVPDARLKLHPNVKLREEAFGGVVYREGVAMVANKPAYGTLKTLSSEGARAGDLGDFLAELTKYRLVEQM